MADEYSLADVLEKIYQNQLGQEAALMELTLHAEPQAETTFAEPCGRLERMPDTLSRAWQSSEANVSNGHTPMVLQYLGRHAPTPSVC
jgi:hypothetical protein